METDISETLRRFAEETVARGIPMTAPQLGQFRTYLDGLREWNTTVRLVSCHDPGKVVWMHFFDSLTLYPLVDRGQALLDIGSGAGFPGIPLKILGPNMPLHLLESRRRKANFLRYMIRTLGLKDANVHQSRLEQGLSGLRFQTVVSRAVGAHETWLPVAAALVRDGGRIILMLGSGFRPETLGPILHPLGLRITSQMDVEIPVMNRRRQIVSIEKEPRFT
jgi:16S rRNA (guanine527-N7)-methyltransferase